MKGQRRKKHTYLKTAAVIVLVSVMIAGCLPEAIPSNDEPKRSTKESIATPANKETVPHPPSRENGTIVSKELLQFPDQNPAIHIYKIFYISEDMKVEAYVTEPKKSGHYPLLVNLHGGWAYEHPALTHEDSILQAEQVKHASELLVTIAPQYRGYMESEGTVQGLEGNTADTQNAIRAVVSMGQIQPDSIYLQGTSMGGGIALRTASERKDIKAVVAVSPFVGWDTIIEWMDQNPNEVWPLYVLKERKSAEEYKDIFSKNPGKEQENSLLDRIPDIQAPVLLLQGTGDNRVVWQTVQEFADRMKEKNKTVKLVLYPDGGHGLKDQYQKEAGKEMAGWFKQYGLNPISRSAP